ncbi:Hydroxypyruvate reductase [Natrialba chahannaoensis JCM 10990]|uniref:Hydroxypyruvate reductase n=1 Tax=Natrialba chahannaoensis JCM 10990 TaxID=1227492 RepID=M0B3V6_9EURY|nr:DUF4147 domain-containing protein [Natrialba chahannaoensis]ELZ04923.1 Hydroxypyruvate reductase [Natrialba chahannaoensis JCM 10990]
MIQNREQLAVTPTHELVMDCIEQGIKATQPRNAVKNALTLTENTLEIQDRSIDLSPYSDILILGGGKAAAQMARVLETIIGDRLTDGIVVTNDPTETDQTRVIRGSHPVPNEVGRDGAAEILSLAERAESDTLILFVLSGGGSSLLPLPTRDVSLSALRSLTQELLECGASIDEINTVRKHLSQIKGGRLAVAAAPATVVGLVLSDVTGNDLGTIASGPIVGDSSTFADAKAVLERYDIDAPAPITAHLDEGELGKTPETPTPEDPVFETVHTHILADGSTAIRRAEAVAEASAFTPLILSTQVEGEARTVGRVHAAIANEAAATGRPVEPPLLLLSGGETTVTICGDGVGGPNQEFVLDGLLATNTDEIVLGSVDTDGKDGVAAGAGALATREIIDDEEQAMAALADNDAYSYLSERDAIIKTGPTGTNVNDLRIIAIPE